MSSLSERLKEYVAAAFTGIWLQSQEHEDALAEIGRLCSGENWTMAVWDVDRGLQVSGQSSPSSTDPIAAIKAVNSLAEPEGSVLLVLPNFHRLLHGTEVIQAVAHQITAGKQNRTFLLVLSPVVQIPVELQTQFVVIEHELPDREQLLSVARGIATEAGELPEEGPERDRLLDAAAGLTRFEAEGAFSLSLVRQGRLTPQTVWELKTAMLKKTGLLTVHRGGESFSQLGGLDTMKAFCLRALDGRRRNRSVRPRGILLLGVPGTGKSALAKALGNEVERPTLVLDVGALMGSLVGQTEQNVRQALKIADAMSPCVLFVDELEKALSGIAGSGAGDSGVSARLFGSLLTWLSDHTSDVFFIGTSNDVSKLPPEFSRAERFDAVFFLDTPGSAEKAAIWPIHLGRYGLLSDSDHVRRPDDGEWTGAEIAACCRLSALLDLSLKEAADHVVPVAVTAAESVHRLRAWATGRCLDASRPGMYLRGAADPKPTRRVSRPSSN